MTLVQLNARCAAQLGALPALEGRAFVPGEGKADRPLLMLVGEAPGAQEEAAGRPFVGKAGRLLDSCLHILGLSREEIYLSNVVKVRPFRISSSGRTVNRAPSAQEVGLFLPWLLAEIEAVRPQAIGTLGNVPLRALLGPEVTVGALHGRWSKSPGGASVFALYHPAAMIYRRELLPVFEEDLRILARDLRPG